MTGAPDVDQTIAKVMRNDRGRLLAALIHQLGGFDLAEDALSEALLSAAVHWGKRGIPGNPQAWLLQVARRRAIDVIRKSKRHAEREGELTLLMQADEDAANQAPGDIPDERLRLIFTCCHPALEPKSRVALTLRTLGGLSTEQVAAAFLDATATMAQRLTRARNKITRAGVPYKIPNKSEVPERLNSVLTVIYLIFNEGYSAEADAGGIRGALCEEAIYLARLMRDLMPDNPEIEGLLALMLLTHARTAARRDPAGGFIDLDHQDRGLWNTAMIAEGHDVLGVAMARLQSGPYQIKAAISALHLAGDGPEDTDWRQIYFLYDSLYRFEPTDVVALNRAVARAEAGGLQTALQEFDELADTLAGYQPFHAARAEYLARAERYADAHEAIDKAIKLSRHASERGYLEEKKTYWAKKEAEQ